MNQQFLNNLKPGQQKQNQNLRSWETSMDDYTKLK